MYGHSSVNCHMPTRCLVCAGEHKTDECDKKVSRAVLEHKKSIGQPIDKSHVKCVGCGENHVASYHGCKARKDYVEVQQKLRRPPKQQRQMPNFHYNDLDFPELITSPHHNRQNTSYNQIVQQQQQPDTSMQQFMMSMMTTFNNLIDKLSTMIERLTLALGSNQRTTLP